MEKTISILKALQEKLDKSDERYKKLSTLVTLANKILLHSKNCQDSMKKRLDNQKKSTQVNQDEKIDVVKTEKIQEDYYTIENFNFYGRGLFLTFIHAADVCTGKLTHKLNESRIEKQAKKFKIIADILEVGEFAMSLLETQVGLSPWNEGIDIEKYEVMKVDPKVFIDDLGSQYVPSLARFFNMLIANTASQQTHGGGVVSQLFYMLSNDQATNQTVEFFKSVDHKKGKKLWDFEEHSAIIKTGYYMMLSRVDTSTQFTVTREELDYFESAKEHKIDTLTLVLDEIQVGKGLYHEHDEKQKLEEIKEELIEIKEDTKTSKSVKELDGNISLVDYKKFYKMIQDHLGDWISPSVHGRLISPYRIQNSLKIKTEVDFPTFNFFERFWAKIIPTENFDKAKEGCIIFHIHGGGFVAMSTYTHEAYLRKWAIKTGIPIVSIDYRKAPEHKYPIPFEDCYEAYKWLLKTAPIFLKTPLRKIIVSGDSAGGNLSLCLTSRCIMDGIRIPDAVAISYPATNLDDVPSPARLNSLLDPMVNFAFLRMCSGAYMKKGEPGHDAGSNPFISPAMTPNEVLELFPPTYINVGTLDPLFDDAIHIAKRLQKTSGKVRLDVYDGLAHGYLNLVDFVPEADLASQRICSWINKYLEDELNITKPLPKKGWFDSPHDEETLIPTKKKSEGKPLLNKENK